MSALFRSIGIKKVRHQKLDEDLSDFKDQVDDGIVFHCKYLGYIPIEKSSDLNLTSAAIKQINAMAKAKGSKSIFKVTLTISSKHIIVRREENDKADSDSADTEADRENFHSKIEPNSQDTVDDNAKDGTELFSVSLFKVSYCSVDPDSHRVVSFVNTNKLGSHECHAFLAAKSKLAKSIAVAISQAFTSAYEKCGKSANAINDENATGPLEPNNNCKPLIDLDG